MSAPTTPTAPTIDQSDLDRVRAALGAEYDVAEELGRGGMAIVYRARERDLARDVAIKVLPFQFAFDEGFVERFQREARIAAQLEHPHIVPVYRVGQSGQVIHIVMKLLRGEPLSRRLRDRGRLPAAEVRRVITETAGALGYAAKRGIVHRDIKPDNIVLDEDDRCVVTDFGIARSAGDSKLTATGMSVGTPRYMSPEQARAQPLDGRSDLYSLGVVGYECLVGSPPFDGGDAFAILMQHIGAPVPRPALTTNDERATFDVIERMLAKDPAERFQSAEEVIAALGQGNGVPPGRRAASISPTRPVGPVAPVTTREDASGRQPSAALDRALAVGIDLVRQQRPKVHAARHAAQQALRPLRPRAGALIASVASRAEHARAYTAARGRRFWRSLAAGCLFSRSFIRSH